MVFFMLQNIYIENNSYLCSVINTDIKKYRCRTSFPKRGEHKSK